MTNPNKHVIEYLDYYCSMVSAPEFGVLLKGDWGSGKTWFIRKYLEEKEIQSIYVSLYGIASFSEIEDEFFRQLHPKLSSKGMKLAGKILKGILKTTIKVDLDSDGKPDDTINSQIPDINLPDYLTNIDSYILIFDDLERCKIDIANILGYINHFVEHQGFKVIIIAHEDKLLERDEYKEIKEKLIGKTFSITPNLDSAIDDFIGKLTHTAASLFLIESKPLITEVYTLSDFKNLRILKQSLWDFERIYKVLPAKATDKDELVKRILALSLMFSLEVRIGALLPSDIHSLNLASVDLWCLSKKEITQKTPQQKLIEKYKPLDLYHPIPDESFWSDYLGKGTINQEVLIDSIDNSIFFLNNNTPNWVKLWHYFDLLDEEFDDVLEKVNKEYELKEFDSIGVIKHVVGLFLRLSEVELYSQRKDQILASAKQYVDGLKATIMSIEKTNGFEDSISYSGLGFHGNELPEYKEFCNYVREVQLQEKQERMPNAASELIKIMKTDVSKFARMIFLSNSEDCHYWNIPIFKYADITEFFDNLLDLQPKDRRTIIYALDERYKPENNSSNLIDELDWLRKVRNELQNKSVQKKGKVSGYTIGLMVVAFNKMIDKLDAHSDET